MNSGPAKPPVFLDRDGTLIVEKNYLSDPDAVCLENSVTEGLALLQEDGHPLIVVTNQSGIGRGKLSAEDARRVNARVCDLLHRHGIKILAWYVCPHTPEAGCSCRKPLPGLLIEAARDWNLRLTGCYVIGDKRADVELADRVEGTGILLTSGHGRASSEWAHASARPVFERMFDAAKYISARENRRPSPVSETAL